MTPSKPGINLDTGNKPIYHIKVEIIPGTDLDTENSYNFSVEIIVIQIPI